MRVLNAGKTSTLAFANFGEALTAGRGTAGKYGPVPVDYSKQELSTSADARKMIGKLLATIGAALEEAFGGPQDVEGAVVCGEIFILQTRPQP